LTTTYTFCMFYRSLLSLLSVVVRVVFEPFLCARLFLMLYCYLLPA